MVDYEVGYQPDESDKGIVFVIEGKAWLWEPVGCVICIGEQMPSLSFYDLNDKHRLICLRCGDLIEVPYLMVKHYTVTIGDVEREGTEEIADTMMFPMSMDDKSQSDLIKQLLDEADAEEQGGASD